MSRKLNREGPSVWIGGKLRPRPKPDPKWVALQRRSEEEQRRILLLKFETDPVFRAISLAMGPIDRNEIPVEDLRVSHAEVYLRLKSAREKIIRDEMKKGEYAKWLREIKRPNFEQQLYPKPRKSKK